MIKRKKIFFIVHTEYHMLVTLSLIADIFFDDSEFDIHVFQTIAYNSNRFKFPKDLSLYKHITYHELPYDEGRIECNPSFIEFINQLQQSRIDLLFSFNKLGFIDFFSIKTLKRTGTKIVLAPDGAAAYGKASWFTPRWSLLVSINTHRYLWKNNVRKFYFYWPTLVYGGMKEIDELWVQFPQSIDLRAKKRVRKIDVLKSEDSHKLARNYFGYAYDNTLNNCIFYTNQPFRDDRINDFEIELLKDLRSKFPNQFIVIKLHPTTFASQIERFSKLSNVQIIRSTIPAEIYISHLRNSIVLSFWSTSVLVDNSDCRIYWLFPMLNAAGIKLHKISFKRPSEHIKLISSFAEIN